MSSSPLRLSGISTGLDTSTIISQLMTVEKQPMVLMQQRQTKVQNQLDAYRDINTKLMALQTSAKALTGVSQNLSPFANQSATSSNTAAFTAAISAKASPGTYNVTVNSLATTQSYGGGAFTAGQTGSFTITNGSNTATINVASTDSAQDVADKVNADVNSGMYATVINGRIVMTGKSSGTAGNSTISQTSGGATFLSDIGLDPSTNQAGADASITVNGITETSSTNKFAGALTGVDITATGTGSGTVTIAADNTTVVNDVKDLISKFNDIVNTIANDTKYDKDSKTGGPLVGDSYVETLKDKLTAQITGVFDSTGYNTTSGQLPGLRNYTDVGISVQKDGTLTLDETKLTTALTNYQQQTPNSASVYQLFANEDGKTMPDGTLLTDQGTAGNNGNPANWGDGIANRLSGFIDSLISPSSLYNSVNPSGGRYNGSLLEHINSLSNSIKDYGTQIDQYNARMDDYQRYLQNEFDNMETMVSQLRSQASYLGGSSSSSSASASS